MSFFLGGTYSFASSGTTGVKGGLLRPHITEPSDTRVTGVEARHKRPAQRVTDKIATAGALPGTTRRGGQKSAAPQQQPAGARARPRRRGMARRARDGRQGRERPISWGALLRRKRLTQRTAPQAGAWAQKKRPPAEMSAGGRLVCKGRQPTLPHSCAVPSARAGLTSLFGMGRGGTPPP